MVERTEKELIQEVHQGLFGVRGTKDMGLVGKFDKVVEAIEKHDERLDCHDRKISKIKGILIGLGVVGGGTGAGIGLKSLFGG